MTDWGKLDKAVAAAGYTDSTVSKAIGHSHGWLHIKRKRGNDLNSGDISKLCKVLNIDNDEREEIFFANNVE